MFKRTKGGKIIYGIVGLGRFGMALSLALAESGAELVVIDRDEEKIRELREYTDNAYIVTSLDKKTLSDTGIQNCDVAVVCIGEHLDISILTTLNLLGLGIPRVIAKATSQEHGEILTKLGAEVVYPEKDMAIRLANRLQTSCMLDVIELSEKITISTLKAPEAIVGKTVVSVNFRSMFHLNIVAIETKGELIDMVTPEYEFKEDDILFVAGGKEGLIRLESWLEKRRTE